MSKRCSFTLTPCSCSGSMRGAGPQRKNQKGAVTRSAESHAGDTGGQRAYPNSVPSQPTSLAGPAVLLQGKLSLRNVRILW